jgi:hypothetical protein
MPKNLVVRSLLSGALVATSLVVAEGSAHAGSGNPADNSAKPLTLAVFGDVPYGEAQEATVGDLVAEVNDDPRVRAAVHLGDIKSGSTTCSDERFEAVADVFANFEDPVVYTPGDNEWTDCHRPNNGSYDPLERLSAIRELFFAHPGATLGRHPMRVDHQPALVENVRWIESRVAFATLHVVGSDNGLAPWTGNAAPTEAQAAEVQARTAETLEWVDATFDPAEARSLEGVVLMMQADTWNPAPTPGQQAVVDRIVARTGAFDGQVLLLQGDSHSYLADNPTGLANFRRVVVHGETLPFEYLRLTVDRRDPDLFSWSRVTVPGAGR